MESMPVVLDVSSDEEEEVVCLEDKRGRIIGFDWIKEFLDISDEESSEVPVFHDGNKPQHKSKSLISTPGVKSVDDGDDDCVVLDGDPENRLTSVDYSSTGSDDLVVVGEKGQIACRDYPHPRHLCVKFAYSSTPHEKHCDQCHCYVCDLVAPCPKWGTGLLGTDHCHATDKSDTWRTLRKNFKLGMTAPLPASINLSDARNAQQNSILPLDIVLLSSNSMSLNQTAMSTCSPVNLMPQNQATRPIIMHTCSSLNSSIQNQVSRPNAVPECSIVTNLTIPSGTNHGSGRHGESGSTLVRNRYQSLSIPQHLLGVRNHAIQRVRQHGVSTVRPRFLRANTMLNGLGSVGVGSTLPTNQSTHGASGGFSNLVNLAQQYARYNAATGFSNNRTCYGQDDVYAPHNLLYPNSCSHQNNLSSANKYTGAHDTQASYQSNGRQNFYAYSVQGNNAPLSNADGLSRNQAINEPLIGSQNENACGNVAQNGTTRQYSCSCQQKRYDVSQIESAQRADFSASDSSMIKDTDQIIPYQQSSGSTQFTGSSGLGSVDDIKRWLFSEENSVLVGADGAVMSELNMPSAEHSTFDAGTLLDFESSWDCLAHV